MSKLPSQLEEQITDATSVEEALFVLEELLGGGYSVLPSGELYFIRELVGRIKGLSIYVYPKDHPPPHFHIRGGGIDASFTIEQCDHLTGTISSRHLELVKWWHRRAQGLLREAWNRLSRT